MDGHRRWHQRAVESAEGQATVEFAVCVAALLAVFVALGLLADGLREGLFAEHALLSASHHVQAAFGGVADVLAY